MKKTKTELMDELAGLLAGLGWVAAICIEHGNNPDDARGIICGEPKFARDVATAYYGNDIEIIDPNDNNVATLDDAFTEETELEKAFRKNDDDENYH